MLDLIFVGSIGLNKYGLATSITDGPGRFLALLGGNIGDDNTGTFTGKRFGGELTHATCGACDYGYFVC